MVDQNPVDPNKARDKRLERSAHRTVFFQLFKALQSGPEVDAIAKAVTGGTLADRGLAWMAKLPGFDDLKTKLNNNQDAFQALYAFIQNVTTSYLALKGTPEDSTRLPQMQAINDFLSKNKPKDPDELKKAYENEKNKAVREHIEALTKIADEKEAYLQVEYFYQEVMENPSEEKLDQQRDEVKEYLVKKMYLDKPDFLKNYSFKDMLHPPIFIRQIDQWMPPKAEKASGPITLIRITNTGLSAQALVDIINSSQKQLGGDFVNQDNPFTDIRFTIGEYEYKLHASVNPKTGRIIFEKIQTKPMAGTVVTVISQSDLSNAKMVSPQNTVALAEVVTDGFRKLARFRSGDENVPDLNKDTELRLSLDEPDVGSELRLQMGGGADVETWLRLDQDDEGPYPPAQEYDVLPEEGEAVITEPVDLGPAQKAVDKEAAAEGEAVITEPVDLGPAQKAVNKEAAAEGEAVITEPVDLGPAQKAVNKEAAVEGEAVITEPVDLGPAQKALVKEATQDREEQKAKFNDRVERFGTGVMAKAIRGSVCDPNDSSRSTLAVPKRNTFGHLERSKSGRLQMDNKGVTINRLKQPVVIVGEKSIPLMLQAAPGKGEKAVWSPAQTGPKSVYNNLTSDEMTLFNQALGAFNNIKTMSDELFDHLFHNQEKNIDYVAPLLRELDNKIDSDYQTPESELTHEQEAKQYFHDHPQFADEHRQKLVELQEQDVFVGYGLEPNRSDNAMNAQYARHFQAFGLQNEKAFMKKNYLPADKVDLKGGKAAEKQSFFEKKAFSDKPKAEKPSIDTGRKGGLDKSKWEPQNSTQQNKNVAKVKQELGDSVKEGQTPKKTPPGKSPGTKGPGGKPQD